MDIRFISLKFMDIRFISLKFIDINFIKFKKTSKWKKVTYLLIYKIHEHKIYQFKIHQV